MKNSCLQAVIIAVAMIFASDARSDISIDSFQFGTTMTQFGAGTTSQTTSHGNILGGSRDDSLTVPNQGGREFFGVMGFNGALQLAQSANDEISGSLVYDNFTNIDFTESGANTNFALQIAATDSADPIRDAFWISVTSGANTVQVNFDVDHSGPNYATVNFSEFAGIDFSSVDSVTLAFDLSGYEGTDVSFGNFFVTNGVPEPSVLWILVGGSALLAVRRPTRS